MIEGAPLPKRPNLPVWEIMLEEIEPIEGKKCGICDEDTIPVYHPAEFWGKKVIVSRQQK